MLRFTTGNLLDAEVDAVVNTVNTVGVMGKGIALMFREKFPDNFREYEAAAKRGEISVGKMFITERSSMFGPRWIVNFPTKKHWRNPSKLEWIASGLDDFVKALTERQIRSVAIPPLGAGNGGLRWDDVKELITERLSALDLDVIVYEPVAKYQNISKRSGVQKLTPARAMMAELVRRYWVLGIDCTLLEVQKLAWFAERVVEADGLKNPLALDFVAHIYGPYANKLDHLLESLDGSFLHCDRRIADAGPLDVIWFDDKRADEVDTYLRSSDVQKYRNVLAQVSRIIDGFESPLGMELLATVDWILSREDVSPDTDAVLDALTTWPGGKSSAARKTRLFDRRLIDLAIKRLSTAAPTAVT